jgi:hypothetical protein
MISYQEVNLLYTSLVTKYKVEHQYMYRQYDKGSYNILIKFKVHSKEKKYVRYKL